jgi:glycerophosphoryl diester phosphodiesterase
MKKLFLLLLLCSIATSMWASKPLFAGHRGGYTGVQNTVESFTNGAEKYGFNGLECDIRVTKDGQYVISHDETTNALGGNLTVADATLEQLQAENYTQTRGGITYNGKICTAAEYLDICKSHNVFPLIELKWTTGINNNDMSNFAGLYALVKDRGLENKAIFMTSMKKSLEYIRTNYPTAICQFLTGEYWANHFDWCVQWRINPTIEAGCFDIHTVKKFHNAGLQVGVWVLDSQANYETYGNMGVYMVTTDYLYPSKMPDLKEIDWNSIDTIPSALNIKVEQIYKYSLADGNLPQNFPSGTSATYKTGEQAAYYDGLFYVNNYGTSTLLTFDAKGNVPNHLKGTTSHGIATDDAGNLIIRNDGITSSPKSMIIYKKGDTTSTEVLFTLPNPGQTNFITASGNIFSKDGGYVYFFPNGQKVMNYIKIVEGQIDTICASGLLSLTGSTAGMIYPLDNNPYNFIYQVRANGFYRYDNEDEGSYIAGSGSTTAPARNNSIGGAFFQLAGHDLFLHPSGSNYNGGFTIKDMSASASSIYTQSPLGTAGYSGNPSCGAFFHVEKIDDKSCNIYEYCMGNGYAAYKISVPSTDIDCPVSNSVCDIKLFPVPVADRLNITCEEAISKIEIYSMNGSLALSESFHPTKSYSVDLSGLQKGVYILRTNITEIKRFVKR